MNEHLMQKERKAANEKSESNHYQFHAISLTSFSNISSIPISTRLKWKKSFLLFSFLQFNNSNIANFMYMLLYTHVRILTCWWIFRDELRDNGFDRRTYFDDLYIRGKIAKKKRFTFGFRDTDGLVEWQIDKFSNLKAGRLED